MNQILANDYRKDTKINDLNKNLNILKYIIIVLVINCIILSGILLYRIYNTNITKNSIKNNENNNLGLFVSNDNTIINNIELPKILNTTELQENTIETTNTTVENNVIEQNNVVNESFITYNEPTVHKTSNGEKYTIIARLKIPSLNIDMDVLSSTSNALLKISLNKYWGAEPNEVGNLCIVGHNYENGTHFSNLNKIKIGDVVELTDNSGRTLSYTVYDTDVIDPYDTACTSQITNGETEITLITCYNSGKQRFIVKARA